MQIKVTDSFNIKTNIQPDLDPHLERRLHLLAYDYWVELKADSEMPDFRQLTPDGMRSFKNSSLLLDFSTDTKNTDKPSQSPGEAVPETQIRFVGDTVALMASNTSLNKDHSVHPILDTHFGKNLISHLASPSTRKIPCEFDYQDDTVTGRGVMMPLALRGQNAAMIWVVTSFDQGPPTAKEENDPKDSAKIFAKTLDNQLKTAQSMAESSPGLGNGSRSALYRTLASAYKLYEMSLLDPPAWLMLLKKSGIRGQKRAPFTPALKLVFGPKYDKTRLTEYAAALAHAVRKNITSDQFPQWIDHFAGGIKGCVEQERLTRQNLETGSPAAKNKDKILVENAQHTKALSSLDLIIEPAYMTALVRRKDNGKGDVIGLKPIEDHELIKTLNRYSAQFEERETQAHSVKITPDHSDHSHSNIIDKSDFTKPENSDN